MALLAAALGLGSEALGATLTVCSSSCGYTSLQAAYAAAAANDTLELRGDIQESVDFNRGIDINVSSDNGSRIWDGTPASTNPTLRFTNNNGHQINISNLVMDNSSTVGAYVIYYNNGNAPINFTDVVLRRTSTSTTRNSILRLENADNKNINFLRATLVGNGFTKGIDLSSGNEDSMSVVNSLLYGFTGAGNAAIYLNRNNTWGGARVVNSTFFNNETGYYDAYAGANAGSTTYVRNNLFIGNVADYRLPTGLSGGTLTAFKASISYNGFGAQIPDAAFGAGNRYNLVAAAEVVNPATSGTPDLHLKWGAQSIDHATGTGAPADDKDLVARPQGLAVDMGAYEFIIATPTVCATPMVEYLNLAWTNPLKGDSFNYDLLATAGAASTGHINGVTGTTGMNIAAVGFTVTTLDYVFKPYQYQNPPTNSAPGAAPQGYGFTMASPLASDIAAGTWTFSNRLENNIGAIAGGISVYME